jgi:hypothetical protein
MTTERADNATQKYGVTSISLLRAAGERTGRTEDRPGPHLGVGGLAADR